MIKAPKRILLALSLVGLVVLDIAPGAPLGMGFIPEAVAVIGAPLTPLSAAGGMRINFNVTQP